MISVTVLVKFVLLLLASIMNVLDTHGSYAVYCFEDDSGCQIEDDTRSEYVPLFRIVWDNGDR